MLVRGSKHCCCKKKKPCHGDTVGFDRSMRLGSDYWPDIRGYYSDKSVTYKEDLRLSSDMAADLVDVDVVYAGFLPEIGKVIHFDPADWPAIKDWIWAGGRLVLLTEEYNTINNADPVLDDAAIADFLDAMDSGLSRLHTMSDCGCPDVTSGLFPQSPGLANIADGLSVWMACTTSVSHSPASGNQASSVLVSSTGGGVTMLVEQLGDGFIFLSGDSNIFHNQRGFGLPCYNDTSGNRELARRILCWKTEDILVKSVAKTQAVPLSQVAETDTPKPNVSKPKKTCGCDKRKAWLNNLIPGSGDLVEKFTEATGIKKLVQGEDPTSATEVTTPEPETKPPTRPKADNYWVLGLDD